MITEDGGLGGLIHGAERRDVEAQRPRGSVDQSKKCKGERHQCGWRHGVGARRYRDRLVGVHDESCPYLGSPCGEREATRAARGTVPPLKQRTRAPTRPYLRVEHALVGRRVGSLAPLIP